MRRYHKLTSNRDVQVDGVGDWTWVISDEGGFTGPKEDWPEYKETILRLTASTWRRVVVQAGGCCGMFPRLLADHFETVITFEPDPLNFYCLSENCPSDQVYKINAALGNKPGWSNLERVGSNVGSNSIKAEPSSGTIKVMEMRLDALELDQMDALLLDVEQTEAAVLRGAAGTIMRCQPALVAVETNNDEIRDILALLGYVRHSATVRDTYYVREPAS